MDVLGDVLAMTRIGSTSVCAPQLVAPWGVVVEPRNQVSIMVVRRGRCWLHSKGESGPVELFQGDVVLLMPGGDHALSNPVDAAVRPGAEVLRERSIEDGAEAPTGASLTAFYHGIYHFDHDGPHPLLTLLPGRILVTSDQLGTEDAMQSTLRLLLGELHPRAVGSDTVITRLQDVLFVLAIRKWLSESSNRGSWLDALGDRAIGKVIAEIHAAPGRPWTVESLARTTSMSRAGFAKRFRDLVGEPPMAYLTRWRMDVAARLLRDSDWGIAQIAQKVGYEGETSFSRSFRRQKGVAPGLYRKQAKSRPDLVVE